MGVSLLCRCLLLGVMLQSTALTLTMHKSESPRDFKKIDGVKPNFVIFLLDDLGYGDLSPYGHPTSHTPNIQRLADEGLLFTQFYSTSPEGTGARASLLTGRYQMRSGVYPGGFTPDGLGGLPLNETTLAEVLKALGYRTGMVGKWHLGVGEEGRHLPNHQGFDYYTGIPYSHSDCPCYTCFYPNQRCHRLCDPEYVPCPVFECNRYKQEIIQQPADLTLLAPHLLNSAVSFIEKSAVKRKPFFLLYSFHHTHAPQFSGERFTNTSQRGAFGDALSEVDYAVGLVMKALRDTAQDPNTFVFLTSDNGPDLSQGLDGGSAGLLRCGKGTTWEGGVRVPAIARWAGKIHRGRTTQLGSHLDLFPTIVRLAGGKLPSDRKIDGTDISRLLLHKTNKIRRDWLAYFPEEADADEGPYALRLHQYKAHFYTKGGYCGEDFADSACRRSTPLSYHDPPLLFNLHSDPSEAFPLDTTQHKTVLRKIGLIRQKLMRSLEWGDSQTEVGRNRTIQPCGKPGCQPFPFCCEVDSLSYPGPVAPYPM